MGTLTWTYTITGSEGHPSTWLNQYLQQFTGNFTLTVHCVPNATSIYNLNYSFVRSSDSHTCWSQGVSFVTSDNTKVNSVTVGSPSFAWSGTDWDRFVFVNTTDSTNPPAGMVFTFTLDGAGIAPPDPGFCVYGTEAREPGQSIVQMTAQLAAQLVPEAGIWAFPIALIAVGLYVAIPSLCSGPPPDDPDIEPEDFFKYDNHFPPSVYERKIVDKLIRALWLRFCKCSDPTGGGPPTNIYVDAHWEKPTWYVSDTTNIISNTDIANTLNQLILNQTTNTIITNTTNNLVTFPSRCAPAGYTESFVHEGLVGEGRFPIADVVGFKIEVTERPGAGLVLSGQPAYLWNMGWVSVLAGELLLEEKRVTRDGYLWFPCSVHLADEFTYTLREFTECRVTELVRAAAIAPIGELVEPLPVPPY